MDLLERSLINIAWVRYSGMHTTMFAQHFADCNDGWRATLALIRASSVDRSLTETYNYFKVIDNKQLLVTDMHKTGYPRYQASTFQHCQWWVA